MENNVLFRGHWRCSFDDDLWKPPSRSSVSPKLQRRRFIVHYKKIEHLSEDFSGEVDGGRGWFFNDSSLPVPCTPCDNNPFVDGNSVDVLANMRAIDWSILNSIISYGGYLTYVCLIYCTILLYAYINHTWLRLRAAYR